MSDDLKKRLRANRGEHSAIHVLSSLTEQKVASRYPMRFVPDIAGFRPLSKQEIKRDARDIEKHAGFIHNSNDNDSDDDATGYVMTSMNPPCGEESHLPLKKKRLEKWKADPSLKDKEIELKKDDVNKAKSELQDLLDEEERWFFYLQLARLQLTESLMQCKDRNSRLIHDNKQLYNLSIVECGPSNRKRRSLAMRDILDDFAERDEMLNAKIKEYERVVQEASATNTKYAGGFTLPITSISVEELDYEDDMPKVFSYNSIDETNHDSNSSLNKSVDVSSNSKDNDKTETESISTKISSVEDKNQVTLLSMFNTIEETIKLSQDTFLNIDQFLPNENTDEKDVADGGIGTKKDGSWVCNPGLDWEKKVADPIISIGAQEQKWSKSIDAMLSNQTRRKRRSLQSGSALPINSFVISRTPYDMPLLISPLSQYEDRFIGTVIGDKNGINPAVINSNVLSYEEKRTAERCRIQSCAASAETKLRRLAMANVDWTKQYTECNNALIRAEAVHNQAVQDELLESRYIRKELINHGIAQRDPNEPPLSPLESFRNNNLVAESKPVNIIKGGIGQKGAVTKRGCIMINAKKNPIVHIQNYKTAAAIAAATVPQTETETISNSQESENLEEIDVATTTNTVTTNDTKKIGETKQKGGRRR